MNKIRKNNSILTNNKTTTTNVQAHGMIQDTPRPIVQTRAAAQPDRSPHRSPDHE